MVLEFRSIKRDSSAIAVDPLPFDAELEEKILGGVLLDSKAIARIIDIIPSPDAFYILDHKRIYLAVLHLHHQGNPVDLMTVMMWLHDHEQLEAIGGQNRLANLVESTVETVNIDHYAKKLSELFQRRRLVEVAWETAKLATDPMAPLSEVSERVTEQLKRLGNPTPETVRRITQLIESNPSPVEQEEALSKLAKETGRQLREIKELHEILEADWEKEDSRLERKQEIEQLESYKEKTLTLSRYLPESYAKPMTQIARWMEAPTAAFMTIKLAAVASCLHPQTRIVVKRSIGFIEPAIIYGGIVTESGQRKSPILNAVLDPLKELQAEEEERWNTEYQEYQKDLTEWEQDKPSKKEEMPAWLDAKPVEPRPVREFYVDKATIEAIDKIKGQQPDTSFLCVKDELSGLSGSYGAYKNGRGEDKQSILSGWNGRGVKKNLKGGERVSLPYDSMSIIGAIQDAALQKQMGNLDDPLGEWGRFLWAIIALKAMRLPEGDTTFQLAFLKDLYARARELKPQEYKFAFDAQALYDNYHWKLEQRRVSHPQRGMRAAISKMEGYTARLALILHLIWELEAGKTEPALHIGRERVKAAIALSEFYLSQVTLIHSEGAAALGEGGLGKRLSAILDKLKQLGELTAGKLQSAISWLRKEKAGKLRDDLTELAKLGYGRLVGKGNRLKLVWDGTTTDSPDPTTDKTTDMSVEAEMLDLREIDILTTDTTDTTDINSDFCQQKEEQEIEQEIEQEPESSEFDSDYQQYQDISSLPSTLEESTLLATDEISAEVSVVEELVSVVDEANVPPAEPDAKASVELEAPALTKTDSTTEMAPAVRDNLMSKENLETIARDFSQCLDKETLEIWLKILKEGVTDSDFQQLLNAVYELLSPEHHDRVKRWKCELDCQGKSYRYTGSDYSLQKLCKAKPLTIQSINEDTAIVSSPQWHESITHPIPFSDLTEIEGL
jgi:hypothetical protein